MLYYSSTVEEGITLSFISFSSPLPLRKGHLAIANTGHPTLETVQNPSTKGVANWRVRSTRAGGHAKGAKDGEKDHDT